MFERFTDAARQVVVLAQDEARGLGDAAIGEEHLLLALLRQGDNPAARALHRAGVQLEAARETVRGRARRSPVGPPDHLPFTADAKQALEGSLRAALDQQSAEIGPEHMLVALLADGGPATTVLDRFGVDRDALRRAALDEAGPPRTHPGRVPAASVLPPRPGVMVGQHTGGCLLCGRDLMDVDRYVAGAVGAVCGDCVGAAADALARDADARRVTLPPRVTGAVPTADAADAIVAVFTHVFARPADEPGTDDDIEDGAALAPLLAQAAERHPHDRPRALRVDRIRFVGEHEAELRYRLEFADQSMTFDGRAVRRDGRWQVSRDTMTGHLRQAGVALGPLG
ncbi:MAG TPA: Clp protease N-terminal domain-containing protein [Acidimicrobiia bacterium]|nr:Clp protease N-terminal domain-containing protein [Acidimicrobiia bacterium]